MTPDRVGMEPSAQTLAHSFVHEPHKEWPQPNVVGASAKGSKHTGHFGSSARGGRADGVGRWCKSFRAVASVPPARTKNYIGRTYERAIFGRAALFLVSAGRGGRVRGCWGERGRSGAGAAPGEDGPVPRQGPSSPAAARPCGAAASS